MDEPKVRKPRSDKGIPKGPRNPVPARADDAPIHARVVLRNGFTAEFGCASHTVENGFHVFIYPSERDRYRETRREFAVSEVVDIEITAPRPVMDFRSPVRAVEPTYELARVAPVPEPSGRPRIHSVRKNLTSMGMGTDIVSRLETAQGPIKMTEADLSGALGVGAEVKGIEGSNT